MKKCSTNRASWLSIAFCAVALWSWMPEVQAQYCLPTYSNQCTSGDYIDGFSFNLISNLSTGCSNPSASNYTDYTATISDTVQQGQGYTVTCYPGPSWGQYFAVWIDFNQDGDFDEVNEFFDIGYAAAGGSIATPVTIPNGVAGGTTRMRVLCHFGTSVINQPDACAAQSWGEVEDYTVVVGSPPAYDMSAVSVDAPVTGCGLGIDTVKATYQNNGANVADTVELCYSVNGGPWMCDMLTNLGLATQAQYQHLFTDLIDLTTPGDYYIDIAVSQWGDSTAINDTIWGYMMTSVPTITGIPYAEDFETGTGGWVPTGTLSTWEYGVPAETNIFSDTAGACSNNNGWATGLTTPYNNNEASYLESPCIDFSALTSDPYLRFDHLFQIESSFEDHWVEISIDGGATWTTLGAAGTGLNWYNQAANWDGISYATPGGWRAAQHELTGTAGQSDVRIRFAFTSDGSVQQEGIAIDNIQIANSFDDAYANTMTNPVSMCGLTNTELVSASFFNNGSDTLFSLPVCYSVNGGTPVCETITDTILPNTAYSYDFAGLVDMSVIGDYDFAIWSSLGTDGNTCNDTTWASATNILTVGTFPYQEKFEAGQGGWTIDNNTNGTFAFGTPAKNVITGAGSGVNAFVTGGLGTGSYNVNENSYVYGPCFDFTNLPADPWVAMHVWWEAENSWDGANIQYSVDTGATWVNIGAMGAPFNWYNDNSISGGPGGSQEGWTGDVNNNGSGAWVWAKHPLDTAVLNGQPYVQIRVAFGSDGSVVRDGFAFDDFAIAEPPTFDLGNDTAVCGNYVINPMLPGWMEWIAEDTATGTTTVIGTDTWIQLTNPAFTDSTFNLIGVYTDTFGLCASDTMLVTLFPAPIVDLMDVSACYWDSVMFGVDTASIYTYDWNNGATSDSTWYMGGSSVMVTVTNTVSTCTGVDSAMVWSTPAVDLGADIEVCAGDSAMLDAGMPYDTIVWSTTDSVQMITVTQDGTYWVDVIDSIGCTSSDTIVFQINALPVVNISGANSGDTICEANGSVTLDAGAGFMTYSWSTGGSSQSETVTGTSLNSGMNTITVTVTDGNGCVNSTDIDIYVDPCIGIDEQLGNYLVSFYPNPTRDLLNVEIFGASNEKVSMTIVNLAGQAVYSEQINNIQGQYKRTLDLTDMASGVYYIRFESASDVFVGKVILQ